MAQSASRPLHSEPNMKFSEQNEHLLIKHFSPCEWLGSSTALNMADLSIWSDNYWVCKVTEVTVLSVALDSLISIICIDRNIVFFFLGNGKKIDYLCE